MLFSQPNTNTFYILPYAIIEANDLGIGLDQEAGYRIRPRSLVGLDPEAGYRIRSRCWVGLDPEAGYRIRPRSLV